MATAATERPPRRLRDSLAGILVWGALVVVQLGIYDRGVVPMDEGQLVAIARRLLHGETLYRDIYTGLFPGIYYLTAALLAAAGADVVVTRWAQIAVNCTCAWLLFTLTRRG